MLSMRLISRGNLPQYTASVQHVHTSIAVLDSSSSSSSSDSDKKSSKKKAKVMPVQSEEQKLQARQETTGRLNNLLDLMIKGPKVSKPIELAIPHKKPKVIVKPQAYEDKVLSAAKDAANALGGDIQKTESELLNKLLSFESEKTSEPNKQTPAPSNLNELISGMKIERTPADKTSQLQVLNRSARVQAMAKKFQSMNAGKSERRRPETNQYSKPAEPANLFSGSKDILSFFNENTANNESVKAPELTTWHALEQKEFTLALSHPPENVFQELIQWTQQGKLWKFPIDNEQGLEEEHSVHFSEHVFMERHLKDWCPKGGPIRHFMELVCVGLSKNPYMKVNEKLEHIEWYREFFTSKQELLKEIGAIDNEIPQAKQLEAQ